VTGLADIIVQAYSAQSMDSARSEQTRQGLLGPSDLGGCRSYIRHVLTDAPRVERTVPPLEAFIGTWVGEGLEQAYVAARPGSVRQIELSGRLPSGRQPRPGHADLLDPEFGIIDFKGRDGLETIRRDGPPFKNLAQIMTYLLFAIQMKWLEDGAQWNLVYFDRSGKEKTPVVFSGGLDMDIIHEMERRLDDAQYAALHGEEAPKDEPITFCAQYCEYFEHCRSDANPEGMIDDFDQVAAAEMYLEGKALATKAERMKEEAKARLKGVQGSTPTAVVRWVHTNETRIEAFTRRPSDRLDVRPRKG
jgi:hypothetical protein